MAKSTVSPLQQSFGTSEDPLVFEPSLYVAYVSEIADLLFRAEAGWLTAVQLQALEQLAEAFCLSFVVPSFQDSNSTTKEKTCLENA